MSRLALTVESARTRLRLVRAQYLACIVDCHARNDWSAWWNADEQREVALKDYRASKTHDIEYCLRLTKAGVDVRALVGGAS